MNKKIDDHKPLACKKNNDNKRHERECIVVFSLFHGRRAREMGDWGKSKVNQGQDQEAAKEKNPDLGSGAGRRKNPRLGPRGGAAKNPLTWVQGWSAKNPRLAGKGAAGSRSACALLKTMEGLGLK